MIHQFILAAPKPGLTAQQFQDYWVNEHAVRYAAKIPQIKKYLVDTRIEFEGDLGRPALPHQGIAEIWLENEQEQLASLQTPEFLEGARRDEPNWAAFWLTIVLDTTAHEIVPASADPDWVKITVLHKRRPGLDLAEYRRRSLNEYAPLLSKMDGVRRQLHAQTNDGFYVFGEAAFDSVDQVWFDSPEAAHAAMTSRFHTEQIVPAHHELNDPKYTFSLACRENWIIR
jgi:hypothetical protein